MKSKTVKVCVTLKITNYETEKDIEEAIKDAKRYHLTGWEMCFRGETNFDVKPVATKVM